MLALTAGLPLTNEALDASRPTILIYADIDGLYGRFHDGDVQLLGMLAAQAELTLANVRFAAGLERKVAERTAELEQRVSELTILNSIQQGIAGELSFQAIVNLVGDKLREVLQTGDMSIGWHDPTTDLLNNLYVYEHGRRLDIPPFRIMPGGPWETMVQTRRHVVYNTVAELQAKGQEIPRDALGHIKLDAVKPGKLFGEQFAQMIGSEKTLVQKSGYFSRAAPANLEDLRLIKSCVDLAVECALRGEAGVIGGPPPGAGGLTRAGPGGRRPRPGSGGAARPPGRHSSAPRAPSPGIATLR